ncbi:MAG: ADP-ribosylglycohydrolase family protein, partial [Nanoarchaeota archaeon]|nr:ADP-ribosylglycohydrolase family protein [Nanoarchaeota archaeon]
GDYLKKSSASGLNFGGGNFSVVAWVKTNSVNSGWYSILEYNRMGSNWFGLWRNANVFHYRVGGNGGNKNFITPIHPDEWYFIGGAYSTSDNMVVKYLNGVRESSDLKTGGVWSSAIGNLVIGARETEDGEYFNGTIDDVMIFNRTLSDDEIRVIYENGLASLTQTDYYNKVYGGWLGQIAGNFLGRPTEGVYVSTSNPASSIYYNSTYNSNLISGTCNPSDYGSCVVKSQTDDDTSMEWVDLWMLENYGLGITNEQIMQAWLSYISSGIYFANKYAYNLMTNKTSPSSGPCVGNSYNCTPTGNVCLGINCTPPYSGKQGYNPYFDYIDAQIESEVFGMLAPGMKNTASAYGDKFARVTNEGYAVDFAKFYSMIYSEAFFEDNVTRIIENVKNKFPQNSEAVNIVNNVTSWWKSNPNWRDTRTQIHNKYYTEAYNLESNGRGAWWIHSKVNFASTIIALLYSQDADKSMQFDKGIQIAALAGWDNDCNAPTAAGVLGIIAGANNIPAKWKVPIRNEYYNTNRGSLDLYPSNPWADTLTNMANRTINLGENVILANGGIKKDEGGQVVYKIKR